MLAAQAVVLHGAEIGESVVESGFRAAGVAEVI